MRQIRILQYAQKVKTPKQDSTVYSFLLLFFFTIINSLTLSLQSFTSHHLLLL